MVPWLTMLPCTFLGKALSEKIIKTGYSVTVTRKIIETICFLIEVISLLFLGMEIILRKKLYNRIKFKIISAKVETFQSAIICLAFIIGGSGFHNNAIAVNPSDLAPKHSGSVFGLMNTVGAIPGIYIYNYKLIYIFFIVTNKNNNIKYSRISWSILFWIYITCNTQLVCCIYIYSYNRCIRMYNIFIIWFWTSNYMKYY